MKISNSKKELARIISENGGWCDGAEWAAQDSKIDQFPFRLCFYQNRPTIEKGDTRWIDGNYRPIVGSVDASRQIKNWHQTILSRAEYFHLYPAPDADGWIEWKGGECPVEKGALVDVIWRDGTERVGVKALHIGGAGHKFWVADGMVNDIIAYRLHKPAEASATEKLSDAAVSTAKDALMSDSIEGLARTPTIEQLAADYQNARDYAERKQQQVDDAKADADEKLRVLEIAGEDIGLLLSPITEKQELELVITDWRDLQAGEVISVSGKWWGPDSEYTVDENDGSRDAPIRVGGYWAFIGECSFKFIRRP